MNKYMMLVALLAGCGLPAEPQSQNRAEIRDRDRTEKPATTPAEPPELEPPKHRQHDGDWWDRDDEDDEDEGDEDDEYDDDDDEGDEDDEGDDEDEDDEE